MSRLRTRVILLLLLLAPTAWFSAAALYPERMEREHLKARDLPLVMDNWFGREIEVDAEVREILETDDVVQRAYVNPLHPEPVHLAVVYSPDNRRVAHPPEVCYLAGSWEVNDKRIVEREGLPPMVRLVISYGQHKDMVYYCYKSGPDYLANYYQQQINIIRNYMLRRPTASALIRFSTAVQGNEAGAEERLLTFARLMMPEIRQTLD